MPPPPPDDFAARFGRPSEARARAPGRVNLIGEHTDYNEGFVLPIAVAQGTRCAAAARSDGRARVVSLALGETAEWSVHEAGLDGLPAWARYVAGMATLLRRGGARLGGFDLLIDGDLPIGCGLASSAALTVACGLTLADLAGEPLSTAEVAELCRRAERDFAGVPCGIMDPYASLHAREGAALLLDCRSHAVEHVPLRLGDAELVLIDSGVRRALAEGAYARRREECARATAYFRALDARVTALRDVPAAAVRAHAPQMDPVAAVRAAHVTGENERVLAAAEALRRGSAEAFGRLMNESHRSLRDDFEVSGAELDALVEIAVGVPGVFGARMTGAGFGGCVLALVRRGARDALAAAVAGRYERVTGRSAALTAVRASAGAMREPL